MNLKARALQLINAWVLMLIVLAAAFSVYSYVYVEGRRQYFAEKRLRHLQLVGDRLRSRVENIANHVLPNAVSESVKRSYAAASGPGRDCRLPPDVTIKNEKAVPVAPCIEYDQYRGILELTRPVRNFALEQSIEYLPADAKTASPAVQVEFSSASGKPALLFTLTKPVKVEKAETEQRYAIRVRGLIPLEKLTSEYDTESFDQLMVADIRGAVRFRVGGTHVVIGELGAVIAAGDKAAASPADKSPPPTSWQSAGSRSGVWPLTIADQPYSLFLQPVDVGLIGSESADDLGRLQQVRWTVAGLVRRTQQTQENYEFSYTIVLIFLFLFVLILVAWPFIKITIMGEHDRLQLYDVVLLCFSAALTTAMLGFFVCDVNSYVQLEGLMDRQLVELSRSIQYEFDYDLKAVLPTLQQLGEADEPTDGDKTDLLTKQNKYTDILRTALRHGALVEMAIWADSKGMQEHKFTISADNTPKISVAERTYFQKVKSHELWYRPLTGQSATKQSTVEFWMEPIESWNTGEAVTTLSGYGPGARSDGTADASRPLMVSLDVDLPSLRNTALPAGFGFAVLDENGFVLFHSDLARHSRENFLTETDRNAHLRAAMASNTSALLNAPYLGEDHRMYVTRLSVASGGPPWVLVVFRNKMFLRTANLEILSVATILYVGLFITLLPIFVLLWLDEREWLWPLERPDIYPQYLIGVGGLLALLAAVTFACSAVVVVYTTFLVSPAALVLTHWMLKQQRPPRWRFVALLPAGFAALLLFGAAWREEHAGELAVVTLVVVALSILMLSQWVQESMHGLRDYFKTRVSYLLTITAVLLATGALPAVSFFRIGYDYEMASFVKHGQLTLAKSQESRNEHLRAHYRTIAGGTELLPERLRSDRGVYQGFFFPCPVTGGQGGQPAKVVNAQGSNEPGDAARPVLDQVMELIRPLYNQTAIESQGLIPNQAVDGSYSWTVSKAKCLQLNAPGLDGVRTLAARVPSWWIPASKAWLAVPTLLVMIVFIVTYHFALFIAEKIFMLDLHLPAQEKTPADSKEDVIALWDWECSAEDKCALYDLATDGFVNPKNPAVKELVRRGILVHPHLPLRIFSDHLRDHAIDAGPKENVAAAADAASPSNWQKLKYPLAVALLVVAGFVFFSQRTAFDTGVGFIGALATALAGATKLFDLIQGKNHP